MADTASDESTKPEVSNEYRTDLGNAKRLVRFYGKDLRYFAARGIWYVWEGTRWRSDETGLIYTRAKASAESLWFESKREPDEARQRAGFAWAAKSQQRHAIENAIALARSEPGIPVRTDELDADPWLLNVRNGVLDLKTGELREPERSLLMTKQTACSYERGAHSDLWDAFVATLTGGDDELAAYIQRTMGYAVFGAWREKSFWFGYGPPDGAKSTFLGVIGDVLGDYHVSAAASTWMMQRNAGGNRGDVTRLLGARLVTTLETAEGMQFDAELVKKVTGGDKLVAAAKYEHDIEFRPTFALWLGANERPIVQDNDEGMWSRLRCVPFTHVIPKEKQDPRLREKLTSEAHAPAVLAWLLAGCLAWQRDGIGTCKAVEDATKDYQRSMNKAASFFDDCLIVTKDESDSIPTHAMRNVYAWHCKENGIRSPLPPDRLGQRLRMRGVTGGDDASRHKGERRWLGVKLRDDLPVGIAWGGDGMA